MAIARVQTHRPGLDLSVEATMRRAAQLADWDPAEIVETTAMGVVWKTMSVWPESARMAVTSTRATPHGISMTFTDRRASLALLAKLQGIGTAEPAPTSTLPPHRELIIIQREVMAKWATRLPPELLALAPPLSPLEPSPAEAGKVAPPAQEGSGG